MRAVLGIFYVTTVALLLYVVTVQATVIEQQAIQVHIVCK